MRRLKLLAIVVGVLLAGVAGLAWWFLRADEIPQELEVAEDPATLNIPGIGTQPPLDAAMLANKTSFFVFVGIQSWSGEEGRMLNRALNRWVLPDDVQGFIVFDAEGFGFLAEKSEEYMGRFGNETRFPMYGDFEGAFRAVFKMPRGHHGFVVVDPQGEVSFRKSGGLSGEAELTEVRTLLRAEEPPAGPPVPPFEAGGLSQAGCSKQPCVVVFLAEPVARKDIPGVDDGFEGEDEEKWAQMQRPAMRNVSSALKLPLEGAGAGLIVGSLSDLELAAGWSTVADDAELRTAFGVEPGADAFLVLRDGEVAFRGEGVVPFYQFGRVSDLLGVEFAFDD